MHAEEFSFLAHPQPYMLHKSLQFNHTPTAIRGIGQQAPYELSRKILHDAANSNKCKQKMVIVQSIDGHNQRSPA